MTDKPRYIIKPLAITQDSRLSYAEQDYICLLWQLHNAKGCTASNNWLADYFGVTPQRSSEIINTLLRKNIIRVVLERKGKEFVKRTIIIIDEGIKESFIGVSRKPLEGIKDLPDRGIKEIPEDKLNSKSKDNNISQIAFEQARKLFPGSKRGLQTEYDNFLKKHKDWSDVLPLLEPAIQREIIHKTNLKNSGQFCPSWKNFQTWINNRCWEQEFGGTPAVTIEPVPPQPVINGPRPLTEKERQFMEITK